MSDKLKEQIELELKQLDRLLGLYRPLLARGQQSSLDEIEAASVGAMLHSFYIDTWKLPDHGWRRSEGEQWLNTVTTSFTNDWQRAATKS